MPKLSDSEPKIIGSLASEISPVIDALSGARRAAEHALIKYERKKAADQEHQAALEALARAEDKVRELSTHFITGWAPKEEHVNRAPSSPFPERPKGL